jgi:hypothetical protein
MGKLLGKLMRIAFALEVGSAGEMAIQGDGEDEN